MVSSPPSSCAPAEGCDKASGGWTKLPIMYFSYCACPSLPLCPAEKIVTKRQVAGPRPSYTLVDVKPETITAIPYDIIKEGLQG